MYRRRNRMCFGTGGMRPDFGGGATTSEIREAVVEAMRGSDE